MYLRTRSPLVSGMSRLGAGVVAGVMLFAFPSPLAQAEPRETITYTVRDVPSVWGVQRAVRQWNSVNAGQPLLVRAGKRADIVVRRGDTPGFATGRGSRSFGIVLTPKDANSGRYDGHRFEVKRYTTVHEFGHVLGLGHYSDKSVMGEQEWWRTMGRVTNADKRRLRNLY